MKLNLWVLFGLALVGFLTFGPSLWNPFICDDDTQILTNTAIHDFDVIAIVTGSTFESYGQSKPSGIYYKPLMTMTYAVLWKFSDGKPFIFHLFQLLLSITNAFLVFYFVSLGVSTWTAFIVALLFMVHPINSEVVIYIADLQDGLYFFWGMSALILTRLRKQWYLTGLCLLCSFLSKESGFLFAVIIPASVVLFRNDQFMKSATTSAFVIGIYSYLRFYLSGFTKLTATTVEIGRIDIWDRLITFPQSFAYYLKTFFWPKTISFNETWVVQDADFQLFYLPLIFIAIFFIVIFWLYSRTPEAYRKQQIFALIIFVLGVGLHSNIIIPLDATVATRWFYLQSFALISYFAIAGFEPLKKNIPKKVLVSSIAIIIAALCYLSYARSAEWSSRLNLLSKEVLLNPDDPHLLNSLGLEYYNLRDYATAEKYFRMSVALDSKLWANWNNLGIIEEIRGDLVDAENAYAHSINNGQYPPAMQNYFRLLQK